MPDIEFPNQLSRELGRLLPLTRRELRPVTFAALECLRSRLQAALRCEELRAATADWTYERARHAQLRRVYFKMLEFQKSALSRNPIPD